MADWSADDRLYENGQSFQSHSRHSSNSSGRSLEDAGFKGQASRSNGSSENGSIGSGSSAEKGIILSGGRQLTEESATEHKNLHQNGISANGRDSPPRIPPKEPILSSKLKKPAPPVPTITTTAPVETIAEEEITIPKDGCLYNFTADEMATFFRHMRIEDRLVNHLNRKGLNGKRFASITDSELESCGLNNPVLKYFRDRSMKKLSKGKMNFLL